MCEQYLPFYWWLSPVHVWVGGWVTGWRIALSGSQQMLKCVQRNYQRSMQLRQPGKSNTDLLRQLINGDCRLPPGVRWL